MKESMHTSMHESEKKMPKHDGFMKQNYMEHGGGNERPKESNNANKGIDRHMEGKGVQVHYQQVHLHGKGHKSNIHHMAKMDAELNRGKMDMGHKPKMMKRQVAE